MEEKEEERDEEQRDPLYLIDLAMDLLSRKRGYEPEELSPGDKVYFWHADDHGYSVIIGEVTPGTKRWKILIREQLERGESGDPRGTFWNVPPYYEGVYMTGCWKGKHWLSSWEELSLVSDPSRRPPDWKGGV